MDWKTLPGFEEKYANVSIKPHKTFGGKVVTVLYGAKDAEGNPVLPSAKKEDGHGEWKGIQIGEEIRMFSVKHCASEGGAIEYGTSHEDHALEDMENDLRKKQEICKKLSETTSVEELEKLQAEFSAIEDWKTPKDAEYAERVEKALENVKSVQARQEENKAAKEKIISEAESIKDSQEWKTTQAKFAQLLEEWKNVGRAGDEDDALWDAFKAARNSFDTARKEFFKNLDANKAENKAKKEEIIAKAKAACAKVVSYKETTAVLDGLMEDWRSVKSAGHDVDEALWEEFSGIRSSFAKERKAFFAKRDEERTQRTDAKEKLIAEAKEIAEKNDYSKETTERMKQLDVEWKKIGYSGKENNDALWEEFKAAKDVFWNAKHDNAQSRFKEIIDTKSEKIKSMREQINDLEERVFQTEDFERQQDLQRRANEKKAIVEDMKKDIENLKSKIEG